VCFHEVILVRHMYATHKRIVEGKNTRFLVSKPMAHVLISKL